MSAYEFLWLLIGIIAGMGIANQIGFYKQQKTLEQLDQEMRTELIRAKNLNESLLQDVNYWRNKFNTLRNIKNDR